MDFTYPDSLPVEAIGSLDAAVTICDRDLKLVWMNAKAMASFGLEGGPLPTGMDLRSCHKPESTAKMEEILGTGLPNVYTIRKKGRKKMIWQAPWIKDGAAAGLVEISIILPDAMPHFDRD
ncbi:MAG: PAS sensor protein [Spirochaetota bacterium]